MKKWICLVVIALLTAIPAVTTAEQLKIGIMQDKMGDAKKYAPLVDYLKTKGIEVSFVGMSSYPEAAKKFAAREVDAMFSGSGVAGTMIIKDLAIPVVRPVDLHGLSTYWAVVVAKKGAPKFTGSAEYLKGKKVIFCSLASSGEFYFRAIPNIKKIKTSTMPAGSHSAAIDALGRGLADVAIVKNRVWDKMKGDFAGLELVGKDSGENPNGTLIISKSASPKLIKKVSAALLAVNGNRSPEASAVRNGLKIKGYTETTKADFDHTLSLLKRAGVDKSFKFTF
jgi:ABC-type phosphate/phosphonate transport system substrate-binding protein